MLTRKNILVLFLMMLLLASGLSLHIYQQGRVVQYSIGQLSAADLPRLLQIANARISLIERERVLYEYYATTSRDELLSELMVYEASFQKDFGQLRMAFADDPGIGKIDQYYEQLLRLSKQLDITLSGDTVDWDRARELLARITATGEQVLPVLNDFADKIRETVESRVMLTQTQINYNTAIFAGFALAVLIISGLVGYFINAFISETRERRKLAMFAERNPQPVISLNWDGEIQYANPSTYQLMEQLGRKGVSVQSLLSGQFFIQLAEMKKNLVDSLDWEVVIQDRTLNYTLHLLHDLQVCHLYIEDVTQRKNAEDKLQFQACHDPLTLLPNRRNLSASIDAAIDAASGQRLLAVSMMRLERFSLITSSQGYEVGDALITVVARRLQTLIEQLGGLLADTQLYRFDGNLFCLFFPVLENREQLLEFSERVGQRFVSEPVIVKGREYSLSIQQGLAIYPEHGQSADSLIQSAGAALTEAVIRQNESVLLFDESMNEKAHSWLKMESALRNALSRDELKLYFQPQVDVQSRQVSGMEALLRWFPETGLVSPAEFIPLAEQSGLIIPIGEWVLRQACLAIKKWVDSGCTHLVMAVNISPYQFRHKGFLTMVSQVIQDTGVNTGNLELEITESVVMQDIEASIEIMCQLKKLGVKLSIDDFGTGYSSLSYLKRFPIDKLKIDQSFVFHLSEGGEDEAIVRTIIDLSHHLGLSVIAEGVETETHRDLLEGYGCEEIQGYLISKPIPEADFRDRYIENKMEKTHD